MHVDLHKIDTRESQITRKSLLARDEQVATIVSPLTPSTVRPHPSTAGTNDGSEKCHTVTYVPSNVTVTLHTSIVKLQVIFYYR